MAQQLLPKQKIALVQRVLAGEPIGVLAQETGISRTSLYKWSKIYSQQQKDNAFSRSYQTGKHWKSIDRKKEKELTSLVILHPEFSIAQYAMGIQLSTFWVWKVLKSKHLATKEQREAYKKKCLSRVSFLSPESRISLINRYQNGEHIVDLCKEFAISRTTFYKILNRYKDTKNTDKLLLSRPKGATHYRYNLPAREQIVQIAITNPELSIRKITQAFAQMESGMNVSSYFVYNTLKEFDLIGVEQRQNYIVGQKNAGSSTERVIEVNLPSFSLPGLSFPSFPLGNLVSGFALSVLSIAFFSILFTSVSHEAMTWRLSLLTDEKKGVGMSKEDKKEPEKPLGSTLAIIDNHQFTVKRNGRKVAEDTYEIRVDITADEAFSGYIYESSPLSMVPQNVYGIQEDGRWIVSHFVDLYKGERRELVYVYKGIATDGTPFSFGPLMFVSEQKGGGLLYKENKSWNFAEDDNK